MSSDSSDSDRQKKLEEDIIKKKWVEVLQKLYKALIDQWEALVIILWIGFGL